MDVIYTSRPGKDHEELRYSLRSLHAHIPHGRVIVAGAPPAWLTGAETIQLPQDADKYTNVVRNIQAALEASGPDVLILHDDQFALTGELPVTHAGPIGDHLRRGGTGYNDRLRRTAHYVGRDALAYDTHHMPLRADRDALADILATLPKGVLYRTVYGHVARLGGYYHDDVKIRSRHAQPRPGWSWCSTSDDSFARGEVGRIIRGRYPDPCPYEGDA